MESKNLKLNIVNLTGDFNIDKKFLQKVVKETLALIGFAIGKGLEIEFAFVGEGEMKKINKKWRGKNKPTDVLSFSDIMVPQGKLAKDFNLQKSKKGVKITKKESKNTAKKDNLPQIIICPSYAKKQAKKLKYSQKQELAMLIAHGILHVLGYDHERSKKEEDAMWFVQDKILKEFK